MTTPTQSPLAAGEVAGPDHAHAAAHVQAHVQAHAQAHAKGQSQLALTMLALGIVYGDIGTSPLYAMKETFNPAHGIGLDAASVLGGVSTILWALMIVVTLKYVVLVMRADNRGEGGIMALLALAASAVGKDSRWYAPVALVGLAGASLFLGEAVLTPAISVLSAVEGLEIGTSAFKPYVVPISLGVLCALFLMQRQGTAAVGALFGPVCLVWFLSLAAAGLWGILGHPAVLVALDPRHAWSFITSHGFASFAVLGAVVLAFTGVEALYADMGHFGKRPVRMAWFALVFPALALNYLGQGALLIVNPQAVENPFFLMFPSWALYPMVGLATAATVIASQATITGAYSVIRQAIQLGYLPRMTVLQTSEREYGQIYLPAVNWILLFAVLAAIVGFGSSSNLAAAYGIAVTGTMVATTLLTFFVVRAGWHYPLWLSLLATAFFLIVDVTFFSASLLKLIEGGWFPLAMGGAILLVMLTWRKGRQMLMSSLKSTGIPLDAFLDSLFLHPPHRVEGTSVFMVANTGSVPNALLHNLLHNKVLHQRVMFLNVEILTVPAVPERDRLSMESLGNGCWRVKLRFGFKDVTDVPKALELCRAQGLDFRMMETSFFLNRETIIATPGGGMAQWRERLFSAMARNATSAVEYFHIPTNRVIELGTQVEI